MSTVRRGREKLHFINPVPLHEVYERWVRKFERQRLISADLKKELEGDNHDQRDDQLCLRDLYSLDAGKVFEAITRPDVARRYWGHQNVSDWKPGSRWEHIRANDERTVNSSARSLRSRRRPVSSSHGRMLRRPPIRQATAGLRLGSRNTRTWSG